MKILRAVSYLGLFAGVFLFLAYAPPMAGPEGEYLGESFRIFYFHVPSAWISFLLFFGSFASSITYLATRSERWDRLANACTEVGWIFATIVLITGPIWARAAWGVWWNWEPRLTSFLVLWLLYLGYLVLRRTIDDREKSARVSAALSIIAFLDVPIIIFAIHIWGSVGHPTPSGEFFKDPAIRFTIQANFAALALMAAYLTTKRCTSNT